MVSEGWSKMCHKCVYNNQIFTFSRNLSVFKQIIADVVLKSPDFVFDLFVKII